MNLSTLGRLLAYQEQGEEELQEVEMRCEIDRELIEEELERLLLEEGEDYGEFIVPLPDGRQIWLETGLCECCGERWWEVDPIPVEDEDM